MKKNVLLLMALCLNVLAMQAQEKQVFTIDGYVDEEITDSCYNIYLADEYFKIDEGSKPVATVPVVNKQFTISSPPSFHPQRRRQPTAYPRRWHVPSLRQQPSPCE